MFNPSYCAIAAYAAGLVATLVLASAFTPAHWWRRLNLRALSVAALGTWGIGSLALWMVHANAPGRSPLASGGAAHAAAPWPDAGRSYRVYDDLNLRAAKGTGARRIAVVPAGSVVTATGVRDGDWWQVSARVAGKEVQGWSSSLWLRRADEASL